jgi:hypothetical protein
MDEETVTREVLDDPATESAPGVHEHAPAPNRAGMRAGESVIRAHVGSLEVGELEERILKEAPGRIAGFDPGEKPAPESTPWRSMYYVNARHSADGHPYAIGDTISQAEAARQGLLEPEPVPVARTARRLCQRCEGRGTYSKSKPRGHAPDCKCMFCGVCPACGGTRYEKEVA